MNAHVFEPEQSADLAQPVLSVRDLKVEFARAGGRRFAAVDGVTFEVMPGSIVGIVGESGSGKSMTARSILRLTPKAAALSGSITLKGEEIASMSPGRIRQVRGAEIAMVFQDPMTSFNPVFRIGAQIEQAVRWHFKTAKAELTRRAADLLSLVGIGNAAERARAYPHEFSGGMRQRGLIAMAVANKPALLIADEPTTALDVTVQDQIMELLRDLNAQSGTAILLITHNIAVVASLCERVIVMYAGRVVEEGPVDDVLTAPQHPYAWSLLKSVPRMDRDADRLVAIGGQPPDPAALPAGCKFQPRCPFAIARCAIEEPPLETVAADHRARCWVMMANVPDSAA